MVCSVWILDFSFFFFKQKTAYDMRISDWSSDVCSSDLLRGTVALVAALPKPARGLGHSVTIHMAGEIACADLGDKVPALAGMSFVQWGEDVPPPLSPATRIDGPGRARLGPAAPAPPPPPPLPPPLPGLLRGPCFGRCQARKDNHTTPLNYISP